MRNLITFLTVAVACGVWGASASPEQEKKATDRLTVEFAQPVDLDPSDVLITSTGCKTEVGVQSVVQADQFGRLWEVVFDQELGNGCKIEAEVGGEVYSFGGEAWCCVDNELNPTFCIEMPGEECPGAPYPDPVLCENASPPCPDPNG